MGPLDGLIHVLNFMAPAIVMALLLMLAARHLLRMRPALGWWLQFACNAALGVLVLLGGLAYFGNDGKMATYAALVLACASGQWLLARGWRR